MPEMSLLGFIGHLASFEARLKHTLETDFNRVAVLVEAEAKKELGTYQSEGGPFAAWPELADATKDDRVKKGFSENEPGLRTGDMRDSIHHASDHEGASIGSDDDKLVWFELGTSKQPPRSVLGMAVVHEEKPIVEILGGSVVSALVGKDVVSGQLEIT
jgi:hypothetical protein